MSVCKETRCKEHILITAGNHKHSNVFSVVCYRFPVSSVFAQGVARMLRSKKCLQPGRFRWSWWNFGPGILWRQMKLRGCGPCGFLFSTREEKFFLHFLCQSMVWYLVDRKGVTIHDWPAWSLSWHGPTWVTKPTGLHSSEVFNFWVVGASLSGILECRHTEWGYRGGTNGPSVLGRLLWYHLARLYLFRENLEFAWVCLLTRAVSKFFSLTMTGAHSCQRFWYRCSKSCYKIKKKSTWILSTMWGQRAYLIR